MTFQVGDRVILNPKEINPRCHEYAEKETIFVITQLINKEDSFCIIKCLADNTKWCVNRPEDILPAPEEKKPIPACNCNVWMSGCTCGSMQAEMLAQGLVKNPVTRLWEKKNA